MRELSHSEQAFLAWAYVTAGRRAPQSFDEIFGLMAEWEDMAAEELPDDFLNVITEIHQSQ